jgi:hypothetical protein
MSQGLTIMPNRNGTQKPAHWPSDIYYLTKQRYAELIPERLKEKVLGNLQSSAAQKAAAVRIQVIQSPSHPAFGQRGLFAWQKIAPKSYIMDYLGEIHADDRPSSDYDLCLSRWIDENGNVISIGVDARFMGNEARFINDYRGTGFPRPNAEFKERIVDGELRMSVWSGPQGIKKGDEILVSYGKGWWAARRSDEEQSKAKSPEALKIHGKAPYDEPGKL